MLFVKYLREGIRSGEITSSVRIWKRPHVTAGKRYRMEGGEIEVDSIDPIAFDDITPELARACGFRDVRDLLAVAKHGSGENVYLVRFHYIPGEGVVAGKTSTRRATRPEHTPLAKANGRGDAE